MDSVLLAKIHMISVLIFLVTYLIKTVLLFSSKSGLDSYSRITKVPEMIISTLFLVTGVWLLVILEGVKFFHIIKFAFIFIAIPLGVIGFKKKRKALALLSTLLIIGSYGLAEMSKNKPFIPANVILKGDVNAPSAEGARVYEANCAFCHGSDGKKAYRTATDLSLSRFEPGLISQMVREGSRNKMPAYQNVLSSEEIDAVSKYVVKLRSAASETEVQN
ncbi:MAG: hypothetical protein DWQ44_01725 [Bacteroidetes bacterium]|nr:MAG: hypothetical protein DWQ33_05455 [Bacteroidota bacterium]REK04698.1 MAG: hypothetical protein DWQ39_05615 [Bacteroidota bacterium]REK36173.1 MAG: hypothetical protein DWQ44_01725 [Bacteroidota bacterium]REK51456.1 MAG: hypothetical protein DWQ48_01110 [Bacteroidota bacterium]